MNNHTKNQEKTPGSERQDAQGPRSFKIDLPDVEDIPGQSTAGPEGLGAVGCDLTIASDDEEGVGLFGPDEVRGESALTGTNGDEYLTEVQKEALEQTGSEEDRDICRAKVSDRDTDGTLLNEKNREDDLDIPGVELDDQDEDAGEEDEENNASAYLMINKKKIV